MKKQLIIGLVLLTATFAAAATFELYEKTAKTTIVGADIIGGEDSENAWAIVKYKFTDVLAFMQSNLIFTTNTDNQTALEVPFTSNGSIAATTVQGAIQEVRDEAGGATVTLATDLTGDETNEAPTVAAVNDGLDGKMDTSSADSLAIAANGFLGIDYNAGSPQWIPGTFGSGFSFNATTGLLDYTFSVGDITTLFTGTGDYLKADGTTGTPTVGDGGSFAFDTFPTYEDSAHSSGIAVNATTLAIYSNTASKWLTVGLTDSLAPAGAGTTITDDFSSDSSADYTSISGGISISGGVGSPSSAWADNSVYHSTTTGTDEHYVEADVELTTSDGSGVIFAYDPVSDGGYIAYLSTAGLKIATITTGGSVTAVNTKTPTISADTSHNVRVEITGTTAEFFVDSSSVGTETITVNGQYVGVYFKNGANGAPSVDNFEAGDN